MRALPLLALLFLGAVVGPTQAAGAGKLAATLQAQGKQGSAAADFQRALAELRRHTRELSAAASQPEAVPSAVTSQPSAKEQQQARTAPVLLEGRSDILSELQKAGSRAGLSQASQPQQQKSAPPAPSSGPAQHRLASVSAAAPSGFEKFAAGAAAFAGGAVQGFVAGANTAVKAPPRGAPVGGRAGFTGAAAKISKDAECVMCQYYVQRIRGDMSMYAPWGGGVFVEEAEHIQKRSKTNSRLAASDGTRWSVPQFVAAGRIAAAEEAARKAREEREHAEPTYVDSLPSAAPRFRMEGQEEERQQQQQTVATAVPKSEKSNYAREPLPSSEPHGFPAPVSIPASASHSLRQLQRGLSAYKANLEGEIARIKTANQKEGQKKGEEKAQQTEKEGVEEHRKETSKLLDTITSAVALVEADSQAAPSGAMVDGLYPRRFREADIRIAQPSFARYLNTMDPMREQARYEYQVLTGMVYQSFARLCSRRMPAPFYSMCQTLLSEYALVAQGLRYGDRPDEICIRIGHCGTDSYIYNAPHTISRVDM